MTQPAPHRSTHPRAQRAFPEAFVGKWKTEGQQYATALGSAASISATETYEWLTGGKFLVHRFEGRVGEADAACIEVLGLEESGQRYAVHTFYNNGTSKRWRGEDRDGMWLLTGEWPVTGRSQKVRCVISLLDARNTMKAKWEYSMDGAKWHVFWDVTATRLE